MKERCFADRKDGTCHALIKKNCEHCEFYCPRTKIKENPFYEFSFDDKARYRLYKKLKNIPDRLVMKKND